MAYGLKYYAQSYGLSNVQWKVELLYKDYVSSSTQIDMVGDGIKIGHDREDDRFNTIYSRYAIIDLKINETFNLDSVQFDDERQVQVKIYKNAELEFVGWLIPFYSTEPFEDYSIATMSIMAKDGINQLKNKNFVDAHTDIVSNKQSKKDIISQALRELGYNLNLEIYYNKYDSSMNKTASDCPLAQTYFNVTSFEKTDGTYIDYFEVIYRLLISHDLRIGQVKGKWVIVSQIEQIDGTVAGRKFDYTGTYVSNVTLSSDITIHSGGLPIKSNSNNRKDIPIQQFTTIYEAGLLTNLLSNGKLNNFVGLNPVNWTKVGTWSVGQVSTILGSDGIQFDNTFTHSELANDSKYFESAPIDISGLGSFKFSAEAYADDDIDSVKIGIIIYKNGDESAQKYYVDKYGSIKKYDVTAIIDKGTLNQHVEFSFSFDSGLPTNNTFYIGDSDRLKVRIYPGVKLDTGLTPTHKKVQYRNIVLSGTAKNYDKEFIGRKFQYTNTGLPNSKKTDELTVFYQGQISGNVYDQSRFRNSLFVGDTNTYANSWKRTSESTAYSLIESVLIDRLSITNKFGIIFEGSIKGYINLFNTPLITSNSKRYLVLWSEYNLQQDTSEVLLTELYANEITFEAKVFDKFNNGKIVDISDGTGSSSINTKENFDIPVTTTGGVTYEPVLVDGGIDAIPLDSPDVRAKNKGHLGIGEQYASEITIGNTANDTLTKVLGKLNIKSNILINDSIGVDHAFIKYNGTSNEWAVINTGELSDGGDIVMYGTYEGERGFKLFHDTAKQFDAGLFFANADTGILGIHSYGWDGTNKTEHGIQIDEDGHVYHRKLSGERVKFLTTDDSLSGSGTWNGGYVSNDIKIGAAIPILWGSPASVSRDTYGAKMEWGINIASQVFDSSSTGLLLETRQNLSLGASANVFIKGNKIYLNDIELDMAKVASQIGV